MHYIRLFGVLAFSASFIPTATAGWSYKECKAKCTQETCNDPQAHNTCAENCFAHRQHLPTGCINKENHGPEAAPRYQYNENSKEIFLNIPVSAKRYLPADAVKTVLADPVNASELAPWLAPSLHLASAKIRSIKSFAQDEGMASEHYKLTLENDEAFFIKVEASKLRMGKQKVADEMLRETQLVHLLPDVEFVTQLASVLVKFDDGKINEVIVFPLIDGERLDRLVETGKDEPAYWMQLGKALALIKITSMKSKGTYQDFLAGKGMGGAIILPDFHDGNVLVDRDGKIYILDYQLLRVAPLNDPLADSDLERILMDASQDDVESFLDGYCSEFPAEAHGLVGHYCE
jgi:hypothetical protein